MSQDSGSILQDPIPEAIQSEKRHIHMGPTGNVYGTALKGLAVRVAETWRITCQTLR